MEIIKPGDYITRAGHRVTISEVNLDSKYSFPVKGYIWHKVKGKLKPSEYQIWKRNGQNVAVGENPKDIVGVWGGTGGKFIS